jgi:hypothetical protein
MDFYFRFYFLFLAELCIDPLGDNPNTVCGSFLGFVPQQGEDETIVFEDGILCCCF